MIMDIFTAKCCVTYTKKTLLSGKIHYTTDSTFLPTGAEREIQIDTHTQTYTRTHTQRVYERERV